MTEQLRILAVQTDRDVTLSRGQSLTVGRGPHNALSLAETSLGRRHFEIQGARDGWYVADVGSPSGTYLNESLVRTPRRLSPGDRIRAGLVVFEVQVPHA